MNPQLVFFDVDGTLTTGNTWDGIFQYPGINRLKVAWLRVSIQPYILLRRLYLFGEARFFQMWMQKIAALLKNWSQEEVNALCEWLVTVYLKESFRADVVDILKQQQAQGAQVVLVSMLFQGGVHKLGEQLGADGAIGTALEFKDGKVTGKLVGNVCFGPRKLDFLRTYLEQHALEISLEDCAAYADSYSDAPMLAMVGKAVAVYPHKNLRDAAIEQKWQIYEK